MTEGDEAQTGRKQTLCQKYNISEAQLDFNYVQECKKPTELEQMLKVLRSKEVGHFEALQAATEARLRQLAPDSRVLLTPEPVPSWKELNTEQQKELSREFFDREPFDNKVSMEALKKETVENLRNYPAIRNSGKASIPTNETQVRREKAAKSCAPRPYESWDNYNVEKELSLIDRPDELKANDDLRANNERKINAESDDAVALQELGAGDSHRLISADAERLKGNEFYKEHNYVKAIQHYNKSIALSPTAQALNNRALTYIKLHMFEEAILDCIKAQKLSPNDEKAVSKAMYHESTALKELNRFQEAYNVILNALKIDPNEKSIQTRANDLKDLISVNSMKKVRMTIQEQDGRRTKPLIEEIAQKDSYYPFTCAPESVAQSDIGTARHMCRCTGVPPFIAKLRSGENLPNSNRLCLRKTRSKKSFSEKNLSNRRKKPASFISSNGEIIEKDTIEGVEKELYDDHKINLLTSLQCGDLASILEEMMALSPPQVIHALKGGLDPRTLNLCVKALCLEPPKWNFLWKTLVALSQLPEFRASVKSLDRATKDALSSRLATVEELGQRISDIVTLYELNGALPPPS